MLELKQYDLLLEIDGYGEEDIIEELKEYDGSTYVGDAISEVADSNVPIYYNDIWKNAQDIQEYIEQAVAEGLVDTSSNQIDLNKIFQVGYYEYITRLLYANVDSFAFNTVAVKLNEYFNTLTEEQLASLDFADIEEDLESKTENFDNNNHLSVIDDIFEELKEEIEEGFEDLSE